jgi:hypothetical protein
MRARSRNRFWDDGEEVEVLIAEVLAHMPVRRDPINRPCGSVVFGRAPVWSPSLTLGYNCAMSILDIQRRA